MNHEVEQNHYLGARGFMPPYPGFRVQRQALFQQPGKAVESMWAGSDGIWPWFLSTQRGMKAPGARLRLPAIRDCLTASIQATGPVPSRHVDRGKPREGLSSGPASGPAPSCLFPPREAGLEFQHAMHEAQKESYPRGTSPVTPQGRQPRRTLLNSQILPYPTPLPPAAPPTRVSSTGSLCGDVKCDPQHPSYHSGRRDTVDSCTLILMQGGISSAEV